MSVLKQTNGYPAIELIRDKHPIASAGDAVVWHVIVATPYVNENALTALFNRRQWGVALMNGGVCYYARRPNVSRVSDLALQ